MCNPSNPISITTKKVSNFMDNNYITNDNI